MPSSGADAVPARLVLDTSAYSRLRRGEDRVLDAVSQADSVLLPATMIGELEAGFRVGHRYMENRHSLDEFLREPFVSIVPVDREVAGRYGEVFAALKAKGRPIPVNDIWIAAATLVTGARLVTFDEDFSNVEQLPQTLFR